MGAVIIGVETVDLRFPTSRELDGSDAMNEAPDYSAAYVVLCTDGDAPRRARVHVHARARQRARRAGGGPSRPGRGRIDANQTLGVDEAVVWWERPAEFDEWWFEEPTGPDDVLRHAAIARRRGWRRPRTSPEWGGG